LQEFSKLLMAYTRLQQVATAALYLHHLCLVDSRTGHPPQL